MKKILAGLAAVVALAAGLIAGASTQPQAAQADALRAFMIPKSVCIALFTGALGDAAIGCIDDPGQLEASFEGEGDTFYANNIGDADGELEPEDLEGIATFGGNQLHDEDGFAFIIVFVDDQAPVRFRLDSDGPAIRRPGNATALNDNEWICTSEDTDCNGVDDPDDDNGLVVIGLCSGPDALGCNGAQTAERGEHRLEIDQEQVPVDIDFTVVGEPDEISLTVFETTINAGVDDVDGDGDVYGSDECPLAASVAGFTAALNRGEKTVVIGRVLDSDGQGITSAWIAWDTDDHEIGDFTGTRETPTLNLGSFGFGAPQILCGTEHGGTLELQARIATGPGAAPELDRAADTTIDTTFEVTVIGRPATLELAVTPATMTCDGVATAEVAATVKDEDGTLLANGQSVDWSVQVLGTLSPFTSTTTDGVAKTTVTPLAGTNVGVPVLATAGDVQASILVNCGPSAGAPPPAPGGGTTPPPGGGQGGTITGPDTGSGGYLSREGGGLPMWPALPVLALLAAMIAARARASARR
jgi:hypothetical protein